MFMLPAYRGYGPYLRACEMLCQVLLVLLTLFLY